MILQLAADGKLNPELINFGDDEDEVEKDERQVVDKRRHLRICLRRSGSHFIPFPCFRRGTYK